MAGSSYRARAVLALTLTGVFYALALGSALALGWVAWDQFTAAPEARSIKLAIVAGIASVTLLGAVFPERQRLQALGARLDRGKQVRLFALLDDVARRVGEPRPEEVYLIGHVNAYVASAGGFLGRGGRRILALGLPLMEGLSVSEFRGVVAHEYGHFVGGDTRLGGLIHSTRNALTRTVNSLAEVGQGAFWIYVLRLPFLAYAHLFLGITQAMSRRQEYAADELAADVAGSEAAANALRRLDDLGASWHAFFVGELSPLLERNVLPPVLEGYRSVRRGRSPRLVQPGAQRKPDPYDSHPPREQRIAALEALARPAPTAGESGPASALLEDVPAMERALIASMLPPGAARGLQAVTWSEAGEAGFLPVWRQAAQFVANAAPGLKARDVPCTADEAEDLGIRLGPPIHYRVGEAHLRATRALGAALGLALRARGGRLVKEFGQPVRVEVAGGTLDPMRLVADRLDGVLTDAAWEERLAALGLADAVLGDESLVRGDSPRS